mmetsp:Transcript_15752/g.54951  ORF Transcript_15752/g.54951 Transcript_15752/m.54951 type:complete len:564 (-) Transcript_15752:94-1785(-)
MERGPRTFLRVGRFRTIFASRRRVPLQPLRRRRRRTTRRLCFARRRDWGENTRRRPLQRPKVHAPGGKGHRLQSALLEEVPARAEAAFAEFRGGAQDARRRADAARDSTRRLLDARPNAAAVPVRRAAAVRAVWGAADARVRRPNGVRAAGVPAANAHAAADDAHARHPGRRPHHAAHAVARLFGPEAAAALLCAARVRAAVRAPGLRAAERRPSRLLPPAGLPFAGPALPVAGDGPVQVAAAAKARRLRPGVVSVCAARVPARVQARGLCPKARVLRRPLRAAAAEDERGRRLRESLVGVRRPLPAAAAPVLLQRGPLRRKRPPRFGRPARLRRPAREVLRGPGLLGTAVAGPEPRVHTARAAAAPAAAAVRRRPAAATAGPAAPAVGAGPAAGPAAPGRAAAVSDAAGPAALADAAGPAAAAVGTGPAAGPAAGPSAAAAGRPLLLLLVSGSRAGVRGSGAGVRGSGSGVRRTALRRTRARPRCGATVRRSRCAAAAVRRPSVPGPLLRAAVRRAYRGRVPGPQLLTPKRRPRRMPLRSTLHRPGRSPHATSAVAPCHLRR